MKKWLSPGLGQEKYRMSLGQFLSLGIRKRSENDGHVSKGHGNNFEEASTDQIWENLNIKCIMIVTTVNTLNKTEIQSYIYTNK